MYVRARKTVQHSRRNHESFAFDLSFVDEVDGKIRATHYTRLGLIVIDVREGTIFLLGASQNRSRVSRNELRAKVVR